MLRDLEGDRTDELLLLADDSVELYPDEARLAFIGRENVGEIGSIVSLVAEGSCTEVPYVFITDFLEILALLVLENSFAK